MIEVQEATFEKFQEEHAKFQEEQREQFWQLQAMPARFTLDDNNKRVEAARRFAEGLA